MNVRDWIGNQSITGLVDDQASSQSLSIVFVDKIMSKRSESTDKSKLTEEEPQEPKKRFRRSDHNGTIDVSRGLTFAQAEKKHEELQQQLKEQPSARLVALQKDDANPNLSKLSTKQKKALQRRKRLSHTVLLHETKRLQALKDAKQAMEILQTDQPGLIEAENDMERTSALTQTQLKHQLDEDMARQIYDIQLPGSTYGLTYDRSGRYGLLYGQTTGHVSLMDCQAQTVVTEFHVQDRIRDACILHNRSLFATAQARYVYIYDDTGAEVHQLDKHVDPLALDYLPYHWLLVSVGRTGWIHYQDVSTGQLVSKHRTKLGPCDVMRHNRYNGVVLAGHKNGTVTLWSPAQGPYLAKMLCHKGSAIQALAVQDHTLVTSGTDCQVSVWDLRMYKRRFAYQTSNRMPATGLDISQTGLLAVSHGKRVTIWKDLQNKQKDPYMHHLSPYRLQTSRFRPYEDVLGLGHEKGISSIVIPGAGEATLDTSEFFENPNQDKKQRQEQEVRALLEKLRPEMICLDPSRVGGIEASDPYLALERERDHAEDAGSEKKRKQKSKKRGRSKIQTQLRRKQQNVIDEGLVKLRQAKEKEEEEKEKRNTEPDLREQQAEEVPDALRRFF